MRSLFGRLFGIAAVALLLLVSTGCSGESDRDSIAKAKKFLEQNDQPSAIVELKSALQQKPNNGEARYLLGSTLLAGGNVVAAEVELRKALAAKYPEEVVVPDLARAMLLLGQAGKVVEEFAGTRFTKPAAVASLKTSLAIAFAVLGKQELALAALDAALTADPKFAPALLLRARQEATSGNFDAAIAILGDVISRDSRNLNAWQLKGDILHYALGKHDESLVAYRKTIEIDSKYSAGHAGIVTVLLQQGNVDAAAAQLEQLKRFDSQNPQTKYFEARLAYQRKDFKLAKELLQLLLRQAPMNPRVLQLAGAVELQLGVLDQAETYLSRAMQVAPQQSLAPHLLMVTYLRSGQPAKALKALTAATGKSGVDPSMYPLAGEIYLQNGDPKKAQEFFSKALKSAPDNPNRRTSLAIARFASGDAAEGLSELEDIAAADPSITADLALVSVHLRRNEFDQALAAVEKMERKQPGKPSTANLRGRIQMVRQDNAAARMSFERALAIDSNYFAAAANLAALDLIDKKPEDAEKRYRTLLAKNPSNEQALLALAQLAAQSGRGRGEMLALLTKAIEADPGKSAPRLLLVDLYLRNHDNKQALSAAQDAVAVIANNPELLGALGRVQQVSGDLNQAITTYSKLVALQPSSPQPHIHLAEAYAANNNNEAAAKSLRKALELKPDAVDAQRGLMILALAEKKYDVALKIARTVQEQRPNSAIGFVYEAEIGQARNNWDSAAAAYRAGLQRENSTELATGLHSALLVSGKGTDAIKFATAWMKEHPNDAKFLTYIGDVALAKKEYAVAAKTYQSVLRLEPENAFVLNNLAVVSGRLKRADSIAYAERAIKLMPNQPAFMDTLAMLWVENNEYAKAISLLGKALELQPANTGIRLNLARAYLASGDKSRAKGELETLAKLGDKFPAHAEVADLLRKL